VDWRNGDQNAVNELMLLVYKDLRRLAGHLLRSERAGHTLQPTALVHEAYLRLIEQNQVDWESRAQFLAVAAQMLRRVLVDHARGKHRAKRGGGVTLLCVEEIAAPTTPVDVLALDEALNALAQLDIQQSRIVELRFFAGASITETATSLGISPATVKRDWAFARAWLYRRLES
jgi:RNA polymerase sigma factor (TIGR02999 family)